MTAPGTTVSAQDPKKYWGKFLGVETYKIEWYAKRMLYKFLGIKLPKLQDQRDYWQRRGQVYYDEIANSGYLDREVFFQDMLVDCLRGLEFDSFFEAGCGFGWNVGRVKREFPKVRVGGLDFSYTQLLNSHRFLEGLDIGVANGDATRMPFTDNAFDVGFSLGVFMNIHPDKIRLALKELLRVCGKYVIHIEYDENNTTPELRDKRAPKTNIVSHDYPALYRELGAEVLEFRTYKDFGVAYNEHVRSVTSDLDRWEGFEGPEKYTFTVVKV
jgi:ubiquinone/menaquinone biosynthesis C-methylase UbiE